MKPPAASETFGDPRVADLMAEAAAVRAVAAFKMLRERGIEPILIKGLGIARFYPPEAPRFYRDLDIAVDPAEFFAARDALATQPHLPIDLHAGFRHLDARPWREIVADTETLSMSGYAVRVPSAETQLRLACAHWLNDGGAERERLWDVYFLVANRPPNFDWEKCLNSAGPARKSWVTICLLLAEKFLDLDISSTPAAGKTIPGWILRTIDREWRSEIKLQPLVTCWNDLPMLWKQIKKRIPPNPIQATIEMQQTIGSKPLFRNQVTTAVRRIPASANYFANLLFGRRRS